ncbi:hypothetical protein AB1Y20_023221 [Prymnesium parvum]|uniref:VTT domain-containing protein n=1 Tax=Prymnesium parvum TaxID=97485 RepID=A0AB34JDE2_PRYPA
MNAVATQVMSYIASDPALKGRVGLLAYTCFLCVWTTLALPTTPLEMIAGFTFTLAGSTVAGLIGKTCGSVLAFVIGRTLLGPCRRMMRWMRGKPPLAVDEVKMPSAFGGKLEEALRQRPVQTICIIRVAPIPGGVKNFGLSLFPSSVVPLPTFVAVTLVTNAPFSFAWSLAGSSASNLQEAMSGGGEGAKKQQQLLMQLTALLVTLGVMAALTRHFKVYELVSSSSDSSVPAPAASDAASVTPLITSATRPIKPAHDRASSKARSPQRRSPARSRRSAISAAVETPASKQ